MNTLRKYKHAILLAALLWVAILESFSHREVLGPIISDFMIVTTMLLVFLIVFERKLSRRVAFIAFLTIVASLVAHYLLPVYSQQHPRLLYHSAALFLTSSAVVVILRSIFEQRVVRTDDVLGAVCGYMLAAAAWANFFMLVEIFYPGSFNVGPQFRATLDTWHGRIAVMTYVSLGSLTSVGSGSVVPIRPPATILTAIEAVFGQFYIAVVVAQLVGAKLSQSMQREASPSPLGLQKRNEEV